MSSKTDTDVPDRDEVDGRSQGQGWWLEDQMGDALDRWGYAHVTRGYLFGHIEIDNYGVHRDTRGRLLAECKDYSYQPVYPSAVWRLIAIAQRVGARPVLATNTVLTERARRICRLWGVRVLSPAEVLDAPELPRQRDPSPRLDDVPSRLAYPTSTPERFETLLDARNRRWPYSPRYSTR